MTKRDSLNDELDFLRTENEKLAAECATAHALARTYCAWSHRAEDDLEKCRAENAKLREVLKVCADGLSFELTQRYDPIPGWRDRFRSWIEKARAILGETESS